MDRNQRTEKWIYLPIEIKVRELEAKLLLAYYTVKENYRIVIGEHRIVEKASLYYPKGIFFSKGYPHSYRKRVILNAKKAGHTIVELDEEGLIFHDHVEYVTSRMNIELLKKVNQEYCWGNFQKEIISKEYPHLSDNYFVTGNPRFDLLKEKFRTIYQDDAKKLQKKYQDFILINTRYTEYNHLTGMRNDSLKSSTLYIKKLYSHFIKMIKELSNKYPTLNIIIRPHPGENTNSYQNALSSCQNVYITNEGNVINWILASKLVIHNGCTTGIEAFLLEKPVISYMPITSTEFDVDLPNDISSKVKNISELFFLVELYLSNKYIHSTEYDKETRNFKKILSNYYGALSEGYAYENIIRLLNKIEIKGESFNQKDIRLNNEKNKKFKYRFPNLTENEIKNFFIKINEIEKTENNVLIRKLAENLYEIKNN